MKTNIHMHLKWALYRGNGRLSCGKLQVPNVHVQKIQPLESLWFVLKRNQVWLKKNKSLNAVRIRRRRPSCCSIVANCWLTLWEGENPHWWCHFLCLSPGKMWRQRSVVQASQGDGRPCPSQMEQWKPCPVRPCYRWQYSPWSECRVEVRQYTMTS